MRDLPVRKIWGVGPKTAERFAREGIKTCGELQQVAQAELMRRHGKWGQELYQLCRGRDERTVEPNRIRKSLSNERTFATNLVDLDECQRELDLLVAELEEELRVKAIERPIRKAFVKLKFADFTRTTRECVNATPTRDTYRQLLREARSRQPQPIRLLGAGVRFAADIEEEADLSQPWLINGTNC
jgi:DNA polymerase-4